VCRALPHLRSILQFGTLTEIRSAFFSVDYSLLRWSRDWVDFYFFLQCIKVAEYLNSHSHSHSQLNIFLLLRKLKNKLIKLEIVAEARMLTVGLTRRTDAIEFHHGCGVTNF